LEAGEAEFLFDRYLPIRELRSASEISLPLRGLAAFHVVLQSL